MHFELKRLLVVAVANLQRTWRELIGKVDDLAERLKRQGIVCFVLSQCIGVCDIGRS